ncbi:MAG: exo-alpha-sialidase [Gemmatimonadetes bacterium]|nr:exo-alpha-sialidase [Gemmatimonadota bacterium]MBT5058003.1 exo-alpha-sialidase [Gemmatimonadota bacterium]MBT5141664.1 exo-alpha-sialidase [Gemmatimonadota bacterium]MBT5590967.1 exo-alpha-sialidase [Gemmatimonadota bacterium]MBT5964969.1 exo-alpha-sialidase [Gemmatimonadota bacterium]
MMEQFAVSRDDEIYEAFPDVALTPTGRLVCVFAECTHHRDRSYTRVMTTTSDDRGRTWTTKQAISEALHGDPKVDPWWNCPRVSCLGDGRLVVVCDRIAGRGVGNIGGEQSNWLWFSDDGGGTWSAPRATPIVGIVPDQLIELKHGEYAGRWLLGAHTKLPPAEAPLWSVRTWISDDAGESWSQPRQIAQVPDLQLCEASVAELPEGDLVCFMRENSGEGADAYKCLSVDGGESWQGPFRFPLPGCHRPVAGMLTNGLMLITHRFMQGGKGWVGWWTQNFFGALTDMESCRARRREDAHTRILPIDFDRHLESDTGYSGWVQFDDGEIYIVNYILDDAPKAQIRGYSLQLEDFRFDN